MGFYFLLKVSKKLEEVKQQRSMMLMLAQAVAFQDGKSMKDVHWSDYSAFEQYYI